MKSKWKEKLTSRKFWMAVVGFITAILVAFAVPDVTIEKVVAVVGALSTLIAYIIGEGLVDASKNKTIESESETTETKETTSE